MSQTTSSTQQAMSTTAIAGGTAKCKFPADATANKIDVRSRVFYLRQPVFQSLSAALSCRRLSGGKSRSRTNTRHATDLF